MVHRTIIPMPEPDTSADEFREAMRLVPSPVSIVTANDEQGLPRGLTCSAVCSLSMAPPSMLVCVNRRNRSLDAIRHSVGFIVNLLRAGSPEISEIFASPAPSKFATTPWRPSPVSGLPTVLDALAFVECELQAEIHVGTHAILIGLVRGTGTGSPDGGPLVYWQRSYGGWTAYDTLGQASLDGNKLTSGASMTEAEISVRLLGFIRAHFLDDDSTSDLNERTPLLDWGVLNSLNTAQLLAFIREELSYDVPPAKVSARNFASVRTISAMLCDGLVAGKAQG